MKPSPVVGSLVKVEWANDELHALHDEIAYWIKADPYESTSDFYPEANIVALRIRMPGGMPDGKPPLSWGVRAGNVIHSLRSALDYLITDLVLLNNKTPTVGPGGNQFPILRDPPVSRKGHPITFAAKTAGSLQGIRSDHRAMIESVQPYARRKDLNPDANPLVMLNNMSNIDKHQFLQPVAYGIAGGVGWDGTIIANDAARQITAMQMLWGDRLHDGAVIGWVEIAPQDAVRPDDPDPKVHMDGPLPFDVAFADNRKMIPLLGQVGVAVATILRWFLPLFEGGQPGPRPTIRALWNTPAGNPSGDDET